MSAPARVVPESWSMIDANSFCALLPPGAELGLRVIYDSVGRNEIPHRRIGKQIRFSRPAIMRWLDSWSSQGAKEGK